MCNTFMMPPLHSDFCLTQRSAAHFQCWRLPFKMGHCWFRKAKKMKQSPRFAPIIHISRKLLTKVNCHCFTKNLF